MFGRDAAPKPRPRDPFNEDPVRKQPEQPIPEVAKQASVDSAAEKERQKEQQLKEKKTQYARLSQDLAKAEANLEKLNKTIETLNGGGDVDVWDMQRTGAVSGPQHGEDGKGYLSRLSSEGTLARTVRDIQARRDNVYVELRNLGESRMQTELNADLSTVNNESTGMFELRDARSAT